MISSLENTNVLVDEKSLVDEGNLVLMLIDNHQVFPYSMALLQSRNTVIFSRDYLVKPTNICALHMWIERTILGNAIRILLKTNLID